MTIGFGPYRNPVIQPTCEVPLTLQVSSFFGVPVNGMIVCGAGIQDPRPFAWRQSLNPKTNRPSTWNPKP